ncbi:MAG: hypothetical protein ACXADO_11795, partial [Candidatus Thorarchaeota archaeon]|jgi:DNA polymerase
MCGIDLTAKQAKDTVDDFRQTNPKIVNLWNKLQRDCAWSRNGDFEVELPSGRVMRYFNVIYNGEGLTASLVQGDGRRVHLYGGKLAENVVQATARDVFVEGMMSLKDLGRTELFHAHDEYVLEVDVDTDLEDINRIISVAPDWLTGCPVEAEVMEVERYTK